MFNKKFLPCAFLVAILFLSLITISNATTVTINGENAGNNAIQSAINNAISNTIINLGPGTYPEQLFINKSNIAIIGSGTTNTIIAPNVMIYNPSQAEGSAMAVFNALSVIYAINSINVTLSKFYVNGTVPSHYVVTNYTGCLQGASPVTTRYDGVTFFNVSGTISYLNVSNVAFDRFSGCQEQFGAIGVVGGPASPNVIIRNNYVTNYTKQGIACAVKTGSNLNCTIENNTVIGYGPDKNNSQLGIPVYNGAIAKIVNNTVAGDSYIGGSSYNSNYFLGTQSVGIYSDRPLNISNNRLYRNDIGIQIGAYSQIHTLAILNGNKFAQSYDYGAVIDGFDGNFLNDYFGNSTVGVLATVSAGTYFTTVNVSNLNSFRNVSTPYQIVNQSGDGNVILNVVSNGGSTLTHFTPAVVSVSAPSNTVLNIGQYEAYTANSAYGVGPFVISLRQSGKASAIATSGSRSSNSPANANGVIFANAFQPSLIGSPAYYFTINDIGLNYTINTTPNTVTVNKVLMLYVNGNVINDEAHGNTAYWALQSFERVIQVYQYGIQSYVATFTDFAGSANIPTGAISPGNSAATGHPVLQPANGIAAFNGLENFLFNSSLTGNSMSTSNSSLGTYDAGGGLTDILKNAYSSQSGDSNGNATTHYLNYLRNYFSANLLTVSPANYLWSYSYNSPLGMQTAAYNSVTNSVTNNIAVYQNSTVQLSGFTIPTNTVINIPITSTNSSLSVSTSNTGSITANVQVVNVTSKFNAQLQQSQTLLNKIKVVNVTISSSSLNSITAAITMYYVTLNYTNSVDPNSIAPYIYNSTTNLWTEISSFTVNTVANTITFGIPTDPIVGIFTVTKIAQGGGGGSILGGGSSGGASGGGGSPGPAVTPVNGNYTISNLAQLDTFGLSLGGVLVKATENFITPTSAGVTFNGVSYTLPLKGPVMIGIGAGAKLYAELTNVSYLPIEHTVTLLIYATYPNVTKSSTTTTVNTTTTLSTSVSTTVAATTVPTTTTVNQSTVGAGGTSSPGSSMPMSPQTEAGVAVVAIAIVVVAAVALHLSRKKSEKPARNKRK